MQRGCTKEKRSGSRVERKRERIEKKEELESNREKGELFQQQFFHSFISFVLTKKKCCLLLKTTRKKKKKLDKQIKTQRQIFLEKKFL